MIQPAISKTPFTHFVFPGHSRLIRLGIVAFIGLLLVVGYTRFNARRQITTPIFETTFAKKGNLVSTITASGTVISGNSTNVTTKASGIVKKVYVSNGDTVTKGQKIADIVPDDYAKERQATTWVAYLDAQEAVKAAEKNKLATDLQMWQDRDALFDALDDQTYKNANTINPDTKENYSDSEKVILDKTVDVARAALAESELTYQNANSEIVASRAKVAAALRTYQENAATIVAPSAGVISDLALAPDLVLEASSTTSNTSGSTIVSAQTVGKISQTKGALLVTVNLSELDVTAVKANQQATLTVDAFPDTTFTGTVLAIDTTGTVSSGVTSYPVKLILDLVTVDVYPNMAVTATIITAIAHDVVILPSTAITTQNGQATVQVNQGGQFNQVQVELGLANATETVIVSGIGEGDEVLVSPTIQSTDTESDKASPFSGFGGSSSGREGQNRFILQGGGPPGGF